MSGIAKTPEPPYYAVIFTSRRSGVSDGYEQTAQRMLELAAQMDGFLGVESVRDADGLGITVSYWRDESSIRAWKRQIEHAQAQQNGKHQWYVDYTVRISRVERSYTISDSAAC